MFGFTQRQAAGSVGDRPERQEAQAGAIKAKQTRGASYTVINLSHIQKGRVRFKIKAKKLAGPTTVDHGDQSVAKPDPR